MAVSSVKSQFASSENDLEGGLTRNNTEDEKIKVNPWIAFKRRMREPLSEFFGMFILILFGTGSVAQVLLGKGDHGGYQSISFGWGIGVMMAIYAAGASSAHLNPAITFAHCIFRGFPWRKFPEYVLAQTLGAICAAAVVYANYKSAIDAHEGGPGLRTVPGFSITATAGIFCTFPQEFMTRCGMFFSEFLASAILMFCVYALADDKNVGAGKLTPLALFFLIFGLGACFGYETGCAINLARDFGPRLLAYALGYGKEVWTAGGYYFWIPIVAPFFGTSLGGALYVFFLQAE